MSQKPRHRIALDTPLATRASITLEGNPAHYLATVLRMTEGGRIALFNRTQGEWAASITQVRKRDVTLTVEEQLRPAEAKVGLTVCFAPIKGGRLETIIEKATELGATVLQPVITQRTIVDKVNLERAYAIAREAAEQCERTDWPEIREPVKLLKFLGDWPADMPLLYGDESGESASINDLFAAKQAQKPTEWGILVGPEGGFTPEEFTAMQRLKAGHGVGLGPRILRADTAVITLCALTLAAWGDWHSRPRFTKEQD